VPIVKSSIRRKRDIGKENRVKQEKNSFKKTLTHKNDVTEKFCKSGHMETGSYANFMNLPSSGQINPPKVIIKTKNYKVL
jgi:hypothetical protein